MGDKILVAYATRLGSTFDVARTIGQVLREEGNAVDVRLVQTVDDLTPYSAVIVGSAIRVGSWLPEAVGFLKRSRAKLSQMPVAYFTVCLTMKDDTTENRQIVLGYLEPVIREVPEIQPLDIGLFGGKVDLHEMPWSLRLMVRMQKIPQGDFRDWQGIRHWAYNLRLALSLTPVPRVMPSAS